MLKNLKEPDSMYCKFNFYALIDELVVASLSGGLIDQIKPKNEIIHKVRLFPLLMREYDF